MLDPWGAIFKMDGHTFRVWPHIFHSQGKEILGICRIDGWTPSSLSTITGIGIITRWFIISYGLVKPLVQRYSCVSPNSTFSALIHKRRSSTVMTFSTTLPNHWWCSIPPWCRYRASSMCYTWRGWTDYEWLPLRSLWWSFIQACYSPKDFACGLLLAINLQRLYHYH